MSHIKHDKKEKGLKSREYGQFRGLQTLSSIDFVENSVHKNYVNIKNTYEFFSNRLMLLVNPNKP